MQTTANIKVLIVDDSPLVRATLTRALEGSPGIEVVGGASDPYQAREMIIQTRPNVIILDIEMPRMDGLTFLKKLMPHYPVPVIICSGAADANGAKAIEAIELGAIEVISKPSGGRDALLRLGEELVDKVRAAASARPTPPPIPASATAKPSLFSASGLNPKNYIVAIGASTGGTEAIKYVLSMLPPDFPPVVMVQHMPPGFTNLFAQRLDGHSAMHVAEAKGGDVLVPGKAYLARGGIQMTVIGKGEMMRTSYGSSDTVNRHCPSVDVLFDSVAKNASRSTLGILLTGMGADGAKGLLHMRECGAVTIAQNEATSVVYGMPKSAVEIGAAQYVLGLDDIPRKMTELLRRAATPVTTTG